MASGGEAGRFEVVLADEAFYAYAALPSELVFEHVGEDLALLETTPFMGVAYDPAYETKRPPFACRVLYCECYGIYYRVDEEARQVVVFAIEDQRRDPAQRFGPLGA